MSTGYTAMGLKRPGAVQDGLRQREWAKKKKVVSINLSRKKARNANS